MRHVRWCSMQFRTSAPRDLMFLIGPELRCDEGRFWRELEEARPRILGAAHCRRGGDLGVCRPSGLINYLGCRTSQSGWMRVRIKPGETQAAYQLNRTEAHNLALESSPLFEPIAELAEEGFRGTVGELLERLNCMTSKGLRHSVRWPKEPNALSNALRRMTSNLRSAGIQVEFSRADFNGRHVISLVCSPEPRKRSSVIVIRIGYVLTRFLSGKHERFLRIGDAIEN